MGIAKYILRAIKPWIVRAGIVVFGYLTYHYYVLWQECLNK
jgi:hypothetical protein